MYRDGMVLLAQLAADKSKHAANSAHHQRTASRIRIVTEFIDDYDRVRPNGHLRPVVEVDNGLAARPSCNGLVKDDLLSNFQPPRWGAWPNPYCLRVDGGVDPHPLPDRGCARHAQQEQQQGKRWAVEKTPNDYRHRALPKSGSADRSRT